MGARFWISGFVTFVVVMMGGYLIHGTILQADYLAHPNLMRPDADAYFHWMILAHLMMAFAYTWIYRKGREAGKPWLGQGLRFGVALAFAFVPVYIIYYVVQPWSESIVIKQIALESVMALVTGVVLAAINRDAK